MTYLETVAGADDDLTVQIFEADGTTPVDLTVLVGLEARWAARRQETDADPIIEKLLSAGPPSQIDLGAASNELVVHLFAADTDALGGVGLYWSVGISQANDARPGLARGRLAVLVDAGRDADA